MLKNNNYKGKICICGKEISIGSKSGFCKKCVWKNYKNKQLDFYCTQCGKVFKSYKCRLKNKKFCSRKCLSDSRIGVKLSKERILKSVKGHKGMKSHFWRGGVTTINKLIRGSFEYKLWRESVFARDNWSCQKCKIRGSIKLQADHIKPFAYFPKLRFDINNGRTLCEDCHKKTDTYMWKIKKYAFT